MCSGKNTPTWNSLQTLCLPQVQCRFICSNLLLFSDLTNVLFFLLLRKRRPLRCDPSKVTVEKRVLGPKGRGRYYETRKNQVIYKQRNENLIQSSNKHFIRQRERHPSTEKEVLQPYRGKTNCVLIETLYETGYCAPTSPTPIVDPFSNVSVPCPVAEKEEWDHWQSQGLSSSRPLDPGLTSIAPRIRDSRD